jgi:hypothetical protein
MSAPVSVLNRVSMMNRTGVDALANARARMTPMDPMKYMSTFRRALSSTRGFLASDNARLHWKMRFTKT